MGRGAGRVIEKALRKAKKEIIVVSPWIGKRFIEDIKGFRGRKLVITRGDTATAFGYTLPNPAIVFLFTLVALFTSNLLLSPLILLIGIIFSFLFPIKKVPPYVKTFPDLHAKIYVIDGKTFLSSSNLTSSGMKNVEFVVEFEVVPESVKKFIDAVGWKS